MTRLTESQIDLLTAYAEENMNGVRAARRLFIHRNTLDYKLDEIQKATGLNPRNFRDLVKLLRRAKVKL